MSIATEQREAQAIHLTFSGRFGFGIDQWAYLPFEVPLGVQRIRVTTSHDRFAVGGPIRNVLDLGVFGPAGHDLGNAAGFRGWSGGARDGFVISASHATPGYLAGRIEPGLWAVALGPVVLSPWGMAWQARVTLERGQRGPESGPLIAYPPPPVRGPGWYRGDLHLHTVHSDGQRHPGELAAAARESGLDFIVSTDHNTNSANRVWPACRAGGLLVIPGEEVTTRHGHWLAVGLAPHAWVDWRYAPRDGIFPRFADEVRDGGGLVVAAHPAAPLPGSLWEFGFGHVDALEVWNGRWNLDDEVSLRIWQRLLCQAAAWRRSEAATPTRSFSRWVRRKRSCTRGSCQHPRSSTGCAAAAPTSPDHELSQWSSPHRAVTRPTWPSPGRRCECRPGNR